MVPARIDPAIERAAALVREAIPKGTDALTVADAAARTGLSLREAELGLHRLVARHRGHLAVTERGELLFRFPDGFAIDLDRRSAAIAALRATGRGLAIAGTWLARLAVTVFLVGYALVFAVGTFVAAIAASLFVEDSTPAELAGLMLWSLLDLMVEGLYWTMHPIAAADPEIRQMRGLGRRTLFHERVNRFFFGPATPPFDPLAVSRTLTHEIRTRRGRIGLCDVIRVTGLRRDAAEAAISRLLVDYDGHIEVTEDGVIFYRFDELRVTADARALPATTPAGLVPPKAIWHDEVPLPELTGNETGSNWKIVGLVAFVGAVGAGAVALGLPWYVAELPAYGAAALATLPLVRVPSLLARRRIAIRENGRRALLSMIYEAANEGRGVSVDELREAWWRATDRVIPDAVLVRRLIEIDGELVIDDEGRALWRFTEIERQMRALSMARADVDDTAEQSPGAVVFETEDAESIEARARAEAAEPVPESLDRNAVAGTIGTRRSDVAAG